MAHDPSPSTAHLSDAALDNVLDDAGRDLARAGGTVWRQAVRAGCAAYRRSRDLPPLIDIPKVWLADPRPPINGEIVGREIVRRLTRRLRRERALATGLPWLYSANRHLALLQALGGELRSLKARDVPP